VSTVNLTALTMQRYMQHTVRTLESWADRGKL